MARVKKRRTHRVITTQKKDKKNTTLWAAIIVLLMVTSIGGFLVQYINQDNSNDYNGFSFTQNQQTGEYETTLQDQVLGFNYHPSTLESVTYDEAITSTLTNARAVVITFNPQAEDIATIEQARLSILETLLTIELPVINAITTPNDAYALPVYDCENATAELPVIKLTEQNESAVTLNNNCITIQGNGNTLVAAYERLEFALLQIIP